MGGVESILLLCAVREEEREALERRREIVRRRWPGAKVAAAMPSRAAWLMGLADGEETLVMAGSWRRTLRKIRARRFDAACVAYDDARLPGPVMLEVIALAGGCGRLAAMCGESVVMLSRARLMARAAAGVVIGVVAAAAAAAAVVVVACFMVAAAIAPRRG